MRKAANKITGLYLSGTVRERTRRMVPADNPTTEIVTYVITDENERRYYLDDYAPESYHEIGDCIEVPVYIKPYRKKTGDLSYSISVQKAYQYQAKGESF